jgi:hypothetical protein
MKKLIVLFVLAVVCGLALVPAASAKKDYQPWKQAITNAFEAYSEGYYYPEYGIDYHGEQIGITLPLHFDDRNRRYRWDWDSQVAATLVTSLWGVVPNGEWGPDLREFLVKFKHRYPPLETLPVPWIVDVLVDPGPFAPPADGD